MYATPCLSMDNYYDILGLNSSATFEEIRRAYRILARRYHPDVNPGKTSEEKFKRIAQAHQVLSDQEKRKVYDVDLEAFLRTRGSSAGTQAYERAQQRYEGARRRFYEQKHQNFGKVKPAGPDTETTETHRERPRPTKSAADPFSGIKKSFQSFIKFLNTPVGPKSRATRPEPQRPSKSGTMARPVQNEEPARERSAPSGVLKISVVEVSVTIKDAIYGIKKAVEIAEPEGIRKTSVTIPPGVRNGSVVHLRSKTHEDLVIIVRVAAHPFLSVQPKGLVAEIPISLGEAINGASITVPTLDEPMIVKVPPGSSSGTEIRLKEKGIVHRDNSRGDLFIRLMIKVPDSSTAVGIKEKSSELDMYYSAPVRQHFPKTLLEL